jgi:sn-glycerol 3-phosphate transport system ATP-binding protein
VTAALDGQGGGVTLGDRTANGLAANAKATLGIRPEHLKLDPAGPLNVTIDTVERLGAESIVHGHLSTGTPISASLRGITGLGQGGTVRFSFSPNLAHLFPAEGTTVPSTRNWELDYRLD